VLTGRPSIALKQRGFQEAQGALRKRRVSYEYECTVTGLHGGARPKSTLTAVDVLLVRGRELAFILGRHRLRREGGAVDIARCIHSLLQRVALPAEEIVAMTTVARPVTDNLVSNGAGVSKGEMCSETKPEGEQQVWEKRTYSSPKLHTKGCEPSSGQSSGLLNWRVSQIVSYISSGTGTG